jgi:hypothetical protein
MPAESMQPTTSSTRAGSSPAALVTSVLGNVRPVQCHAGIAVWVAGWQASGFDISVEEAGRRHSVFDHYRAARPLTTSKPTEGPPRKKSWTEGPSPPPLLGHL